MYVSWPALQYLGWYNPIAKEANLNAPAIKKWLSVGAQPTETVGELLGSHEGFADTQ